MTGKQKTAVKLAEKAKENKSGVRCESQVKLNIKTSIHSLRVVNNDRCQNFHGSGKVIGS